MVSGISQTSQMASVLFSKLDTKSQGYIEKSDLETAFSQISSTTSSSSSTTGSSSSTTSADDVFSALDTNSDGKVTQDELASVLAKLQESMTSQYGSDQTQGAGGMSPPTPPADDTGFTKDELTSQLQSADSSDTKQTDMLNKIVNNFSAADTNGDGKVSAQEAVTYDKSTQSTSSTDSSSTTTTTASTTASDSDAQVMKKIMQLMQAYGTGLNQENSGIASLLSVSA
jgi:Ca2+-binding EF-hand superfamily protein